MTCIADEYKIREGSCTRIYAIQATEHSPENEVPLEFINRRCAARLTG